MSSLPQNIATTFKLVLADFCAHYKSALVICAVLIALNHISLFLDADSFGFLIILMLFFQILATVVAVCKWHQICLQNEDGVISSFFNIDELAYIGKSGLLSLFSFMGIIFAFLPLVYFLQLSSLWLKIILVLPVLIYTYFIGLGVSSFLWRFATSLPHIAIGKDEQPELIIYSDIRAHHHFLLLSLITAIIWALPIWLLPYFDQSATAVIGSLILAISSLFTASLLNATYRQYNQLT